MMIKVCHMTSAHDSHDIRIYVKECRSLSESGYEVCLVAQGESWNEDGVRIVGLGEANYRKRHRMLRIPKSVYEQAAALDCDVYHFHDLELLPYGLRLKKAGKKVVYDSHEDMPASVMDKEYIPRFLRKCVARLLKAYETHVVKRLDAVVAATPHIAKQFAGRAKKIAIVNNYPKLDDIAFHDTPFEDREPVLCYAGALDRIRGEQVMAEAMDGVDGRLVLAGGRTADAEHNMEKHPNVQYIGRLSRKEVNELYGKSRAGIVLYQPAANHMDAQPIKMFEFMAAGLPVIASDFPLWRDIIEANRCGICVDPTDVALVRNAIQKLLSNCDSLAEMAACGRKAVLEKYNWQNEEKALLELYRWMAPLP